MNICGDAHQQAKCLITVDSGTSEMTMPSWAIQKVIGKMPLKQNPMKCKNQTDFGDLTFVINGFEYTLPNDDWVEKQIDMDSGNKMAQEDDNEIEEAQVGPGPINDGFLQEI